jgi:hypothetical protein
MFPEFVTESRNCWAVQPAGGGIITEVVISTTAGTKITLFELAQAGQVVVAQSAGELLALAARKRERTPFPARWSEINRNRFAAEAAASAPARWV